MDVEDGEKLMAAGAILAQYRAPSLDENTKSLIALKGALLRADEPGKIGEWIVEYLNDAVYPIGFTESLDLLNMLANAGVSEGIGEAMTAKAETPSLAYIERRTYYNFAIGSYIEDYELAVTSLDLFVDFLNRIETSRPLYVFEQKRSLSRHYMLVEAYERGLEILEKTISYPNYRLRNSDYFLRALEALKLGEYEAAITWAEKLKENMGSDADVRPYAILAQAYARLGFEEDSQSARERLPADMTAVDIIDLPIMSPVIDRPPSSPPRLFYPPAALQRGLQDRCAVLFDVTYSGLHKDIQALCTNEVFTKETERAIARIDILPTEEPTDTRLNLDVVYPLTFSINN